MGISNTNISVTANVSQVKLAMDEVNKQLDSVSAAPLEKLRDKSGDAILKMNASIGLAVANLDTLKTALANTGNVDLRKLKQVETQFAALKRLGLDDDRAGKFARTIDQIKVGGGIRDTAAEAKIAATNAALQSRSATVVAALKQRDAGVIAGIAQEIAAKDKSRRAPATRLDDVLNEVGALRHVAGSSARGEGGALEKVDAILGDGKFSLKKGAKFGVAGLVASFVADTVAGATESLNKSLDAGDQQGLSDREFYGGGLKGNLLSGANAIGADLPIVSGLLKSVENIREAWTGIRGETERTNALIAEQDRVAKDHVETLKQQKFAIQEVKDRQEESDRKFAASQLGGRAGRTANIVADEDSQVAALKRQRDTEVQAAADKRDALLKPIVEAKKADEAQLSNPRLAAGAKDRIKAHDLSIRAITSDYNGNVSIANARQEVEKEDIIRRNTKAILTDNKSVLDTAGFGNALESLTTDTRLMNGDPVTAALNRFKEYGPLAGAGLKAATEAVEKYVAATKRAGVEGEISRILDVKSDAGLSAIDAAIQRYTDAGVGKERIATVRLNLETKAALNNVAQVKDEVAALDRRINISLAPNEPARIRSEATAENEERKRLTGVGYNTTDLETEINKRLDAYFADLAHSVREATKDPLDRLKDRVKELNELRERKDDKGNPLISQKQYDKAAGQAGQEYFDSIGAPNPKMLEFGDASTQRELAILGRQVIDSTRPELYFGADIAKAAGVGGGGSGGQPKDVPAKLDKSNTLLERCANALEKGNGTSTSSITGP